MEILIECTCGNTLSIRRTDAAATYTCFIIEKCSCCEKENYEAGEADAKQEQA